MLRSLAIESRAVFGKLLRFQIVFELFQLPIQRKLIQLLHLGERECSELWEEIPMRSPAVRIAAERSVGQ